MTSTLPLTVWMNMPSFYQVDLFQALGTIYGVDLSVVYARDLPTERINLGWESSRSRFPTRTLPEKVAMSTAKAISIARRQKDRIHIVNGVWAEPAFLSALLYMRARGHRYVLYSEAPNPNYVRGPIKRALQQIVGPIIARRAIGTLPVAQHGVDFYRSLGVPGERLYRFGYFRARPQDTPQTRSSRGKIHFVYVGQLIERKGLDILLRAMSDVPANLLDEIRVSIIGDGSDKPLLQQLASRLGLQSQIEFRGVVPSQQVLEEIRTADALVLPSRWDGWGLVANEALMVGVPVIISDSCGAAELIRDGANGFVFASENPNSLNRVIKEFLAVRARWPIMRQFARRTGHAIDASIAADYLVTCLNHMCGEVADKPLPPWRALAPVA